MDLAGKLQVRGEPLAVHGRPDDVVLGGVVVEADATAVLAFVLRSQQLASAGGPALTAAQEDRLAWIAYPKAGQLGTDLDRDRLVAAAREHGVQPVRQVAIDRVWSALRFRPA